MGFFQEKIICQMDKIFFVCLITALKVNTDFDLHVYLFISQSCEDLRKLYFNGTKSACTTPQCRGFEVSHKLRKSFTPTKTGGARLYWQTQFLFPGNWKGQQVKKWKCATKYKYFSFPPPHPKGHLESKMCNVNQT